MLHGGERKRRRSSLRRRGHAGRWRPVRWRRRSSSSIRRGRCSIAALAANTMSVEQQDPTLLMKKNFSARQDFQLCQSKAVDGPIRSGPFWVNLSRKEHFIKCFMNNRIVRASDSDENILITTLKRALWSEHKALVERWRNFTFTKEMGYITFAKKSLHVTRVARPLNWDWWMCETSAIKRGSQARPVLLVGRCGRSSQEKWFYGPYRLPRWALECPGRCSRRSEWHLGAVQLASFRRGRTDCPEMILRCIKLYRKCVVKN